MTQKDFVIVAKIVSSISDPWARNEAINLACYNLAVTYPRFDAPKFRKYILSIEKDAQITMESINVN